MTTKARRKRTMADDVLAQGREEYRISEIAPAFAERLGITHAGARSRLYRAAEDGRLIVRSYLGTLQVPYHEAERILRGDQL